MFILFEIQLKLQTLLTNGLFQILKTSNDLLSSGSQTMDLNFLMYFGLLKLDSGNHFWKLKILFLNQVKLRLTQADTFLY